MINRGKQFEEVIKKSFQKIPGVSIDRIHDQTTGYYGSSNISDFILYRKPYEWYIECKSVHGNTFPLSNISEKQWNGLSEKSSIYGVFAGVICWWIDKDVTLYLSIQLLRKCRDEGLKSINYEKAQSMQDVIVIQGTKKRVFFDYDMKSFFKEFI